ncbi:Stp1/IreP family PP2C-type Ser/Thr phosphatase [Gracilibacillus kekensis]|uniref:protein-serine/threonine phosphatase n=1 Tax=Gracilibacillus kekensis TaxID=1027249 RepID=A0A1M7PF68_9BACI|nr:Stp1/IreP family PP2C-type Ser/Thr phosphatase [Gracilibacillus kekensis]SHN15608.1 protein phosphatase [Gracilibacillus kekensis]
MRYLYQSDKGKIRELNEDAVAIFSNEEAILAIVADGMGGHQAGDVASQLAIDELEKYWLAFEGTIAKDYFEKWLRETIIKVNNTVYQKSQSDIECKGMGTTVVAAICTKDYLIIGHIGDSRAYLMNQSEWQQVTEDHSLVGELVRTGQLSQEDAEVHPRRNVILKALGTELNLEPDMYVTSWNEYDRLLICSDGLSNKLTDQELHEVIVHTNNEKISQTLIDMANNRGGEDNISLAIIDQRDKVGDPTC